MRIPELVLLCAISFLGIYGVFYIAESSYQRIEITCQEGC